MQNTLEFKCDQSKAVFLKPICGENDYKFVLLLGIFAKNHLSVRKRRKTQSNLSVTSVRIFYFLFLKAVFGKSLEHTAYKQLSVIGQKNSQK